MLLNEQFVDTAFLKISALKKWKKRLLINQKTASFQKQGPEETTGKRGFHFHVNWISLTQKGAVRLTPGSHLCCCKASSSLVVKDEKNASFSSSELKEQDQLHKWIDVTYQNVKKSVSEIFFKNPLNLIFHLLRRGLQFKFAK